MRVWDQERADSSETEQEGTEVPAWRYRALVQSGLMHLCMCMRLLWVSDRAAMQRPGQARIRPDQGGLQAPLCLAAMCGLLVWCGGFQRRGLWLAHAPRQCCCCQWWVVLALRTKRSHCLGVAVFLPITRRRGPRLSLSEQTVSFHCGKYQAHLGCCMSFLHASVPRSGTSKCAEKRGWKVFRAAIAHLS